MICHFTNALQKNRRVFFFTGTGLLNAFLRGRQDRPPPAPASPRHVAASPRGRFLNAAVTRMVSGGRQTVLGSDTWCYRPATLLLLYNFAVGTTTPIQAYWKFRVSRTRPLTRGLHARFPYSEAPVRHSHCPLVVRVAGRK